MFYKKFPYKSLALVGLVSFLSFGLGLWYRNTAGALGLNFATQLAEASQKLEMSNIRVVYLTNNEVLDFSKNKELNSIVITKDASIVKELDQLEKLDVLVLDSSYKSEWNPEWLQQRYREGLAIIGVEMSIKELAEIVGDSATFNSTMASASAPINTNTISVLKFVVRGDNPSEVEKYLREYGQVVTSESGGVIPGIMGHLSVERTRGQLSLSDYVSFQDALAKAIGNLQ